MYPNTLYLRINKQFNKKAYYIIDIKPKINQPYTITPYVNILNDIPKPKQKNFFAYNYDARDKPYVFFAFMYLPNLNKQLKQHMNTCCI